MKKRGQFYLIGALIIILVVVSLLAVNNYARSKPTESNVYDISNDISRESKDVIDYGVYNSADIPALMNSFTNSYVKAEPSKKWFFVYGNQDNVTILAYLMQTSAISVDIGGGASRIDVDTNVVRFDKSVKPDPGSNEVTITIDGVSYDFNINAGQNFYFIISEKTAGGDQITKTGS